MTRIGPAPAGTYRHRHGATQCSSGKGYKPHRRESIPMKDYLDQLEALLLPLARLYQSIDVETSSKAEPSAD